MKTISPNMLRRRGAITLLIVCLALALPAYGDYDLSWNTIDGGGGQSKGGPYTLTGTIGQPDAAYSAGYSEGGSYKLLGGFWPGGYWWAYPDCWDCNTQCHGDADCDCDVDTSDWSPFYDGFLKTYPDPDYVENACADYNKDGTINTTDWPEFRDNFGKTCETGLAQDCPPGDINEIFKP